MVATLVRTLVTASVGDPLPPVGADPRLVTLWHHWNGLRGGRAMPARADLDPADVRHLLPNLFLVDVGADPSDLRFRLVGTEIVRLFGMELTGRPVGTGMGPTAARLTRARFAFVARNARPAYATGLMEAVRTNRTPFQRLLLPLSADGARVDMLLGILVGLDLGLLLAGPRAGSGAGCPSADRA